MHGDGTDMDSEIRGWPKHGDQGRRGVESVGRLWQKNEKGICGIANLFRLLRAELEFHVRHGSTRVFLVLCVFVGKVAFFLPAPIDRFSFFGVCRRLVVFSLFFFLLHCNHLSGVLRGFFQGAMACGFLASVSPLSIAFAVALGETLVSKRESGRRYGTSLHLVLPRR